jgi:ABC-type transporter Mla MlaB component
MREGTTLPASDRPADVPIIDCDVGWLQDVDLGALDTLARMQLVARRMGFGLRLVGASPELRGLLTLTGLEEVLPCRDDMGADALAPEEPPRTSSQHDPPVRPPR